MCIFVKGLPLQQLIPSSIIIYELYLYSQTELSNVRMETAYSILLIDKAIGMKDSSAITHEDTTFLVVHLFIEPKFHWCKSGLTKWIFSVFLKLAIVSWKRDENEPCSFHYIPFVVLPPSCSLNPRSWRNSFDLNLLKHASWFGSELRSICHNRLLFAGLLLIGDINGSALILVFFLSLYAPTLLPPFIFEQPRLPVFF
jgi:hypothetical protein